MFLCIDLGEMFLAIQNGKGGIFTFVLVIYPSKEGCVFSDFFTSNLTV